MFTKNLASFTKQFKARDSLVTYEEFVKKTQKLD